MTFAMVDCRLFLSTFGLIFLAELPDKTAFAAMLMSARARPLAVFAGACAAFLIQSVVAVAAGSLIGMLPGRVVYLVVGLVFIALAVFMWTRRAEEEEARRLESRGFLRTAAAAFLIIFLAEWGDLTQFATASIAARYHAPWTILWAATLALWSATGLFVLIGRWTRTVLNPVLLQRLAAVVFLGIGAWFLLRR